MKWNRSRTLIRSLGQVKQKYTRLPIYPKTHYVMPRPAHEQAIVTVQEELKWWEAALEKQGKLLEAQRIHQRTLFDLEMIEEVGYCHGIENYSRHFTGRKPGEPPPTLLDYLPQDSLMFIDESHQTVPQLRGMYQRRPFAQGKSGRVRLPTAVSARQSPADVRGV